MKVKPPASFRISAELLLRDVQARLASRIPGWDSQTPDPTDPGWILLEQAAWMAEVLSDELDQYPMAVLRQLLHVVGMHVQPAQPSLAVVGLDPADVGRLVFSSDRAETLRLLSAPSEVSGGIEFAPVERDIPLCPMAVLSLASIQSGELVRRGQPAVADALAAWFGPARPSTAFHGESVRFTLMAADIPALRKKLDAVFLQFQDLRIGWMRWDIHATEATSITIEATVNPVFALSMAAPGGVTPGGDLVLPWGNLDGCVWRPQVRVVDHPSLPARLRGRAPLPSDVEGEVLLPAVPPNIGLDGLLVVRAAPVPTTVCVAMWDTLTRLDTSLAAWRPLVEREYDGLDAEEPAWVGAAIDCGVWERWVIGPHGLIHIDFRTVTSGPVRVGLIFDAALPATVHVHLLREDGGMDADALEARRVFALPCPTDVPGRDLRTIVVYEIPADAEALGCVIAVPGDTCVGVLLNPLLVANAPAVRDGRTVRVERSVPETVSLLHENLVTPDVVQRLVEEPLPEDTRSLLRRVPLAWFGVVGEAVVSDFVGVGTDAAAGELRLNSADVRGHLRAFRPGTTLELRWYRRTDGERGNVGANAIRMVEQETTANVTVLRATNPLPAGWGMAREQDEAATRRLLAPAEAVPTLPADLERAARHALGPSCTDWVVRSWSHAERALVSVATWPPPALGVADPVRDALALAGPDTLVFVVGPSDRMIRSDELDRARRVIDALTQRIGTRMPIVRRSLVFAFVPLTLQVDGPTDAVALPCFNVHGLKGRLVDGAGRRGPVPRAALLNAAVVQIAAPEESA